MTGLQHELRKLLLCTERCVLLPNRRCVTMSRISRTERPTKHPCCASYVLPVLQFRQRVSGHVSSAGSLSCSRTTSRRATAQGCPACGCPRPTSITTAPTEESSFHSLEVAQPFPPVLNMLAVSQHHLCLHVIIHTGQLLYNPLPLVPLTATCSHR